MKVIINGNEYDWSGDGGKIMYEAVLKQAGIRGTPSMTYSVPRSNPAIQGIIYPGKSIDLVPGLVINAIHTGNA